ncbi:hypothetical protein FJ987_23295 [Mesorhizobium sp. CU2]|uniref:hypothetical protein n=1 Tax=unclassified Mesorhizobium TaxID=325217 RepID=UPI001129F618|nr:MULTISPECIES: hypothetical protein [unclassified Mesorhizobium]TPN77511.1 hypothetical protein FJ988_26320 [Mesorhizobium sp. CU3]TPO08758.1 hypothetical protein FJ987_23295 [Mesorhizobium sp. CU2]
MFLLRWLRRLLKTILWLIVLVVLIPVVGLTYGFLTTSSLDKSPLPGIAEGAPPPAIAQKVRQATPGYQLPQLSTWLAYPKSAAVHAARDYAAFVSKDQPSGFPYWTYVGRYWQDYAVVIRATSARGVDILDYAMPTVIGTGLTIDGAVQWAYENTVGRVTEVIAGKRIAADTYQAKVAADFAASLDSEPWSDFAYAQKRAELFAVEPATGDDSVRTSERKLAFGFADTVKQWCADLSKSVFADDPGPADIHVWAKGPVGEAARNEPDTLLERDLGADGTIFITRRSQAFTDMTPRLIDKGVSFVEIGGNDEILVTVLSSAEVAAPEGSRILFSHQVPIDPDTRRTALTVAVRKLHNVLPALAKAGARLERVYVD